jgi:hypothetical protein
MEDIVRKTRIVLFVLSCIFIFAFYLSVFSDDLADAEAIKWDTVSEPFFNKYNPFGASARAIGMGESFAAIADDASAVYYNPAGLAQLDHNELMWTGGSYYKSMPYTDFASFVMSLGGQYFGLSYTRLYHPAGRYPDNVDIPVPGVNPTQPVPVPPALPVGLFYDPATNGIFNIPGGLYETWYGGPKGLNASEQAFLANIYRELINRQWQEDQVYLTYATPLTGDKSFMMGINVKYQFTDADMKDFFGNHTPAFASGNDLDAWAWALDLGFLYKLRIIEFLKDFNIGIMLRDVSGRMKRYNTGAEEPLYFTSTIAVSMRTTELIEKEVTSFSVDWDSVNDPKVFDIEKNRLRFGFEQWFLDSHFALRGGLVNFMNPGPWRMSLGISARYWLGIDYAYVTSIPFDQQAEDEPASHWITVYWQWGKVARKLPTPDVFAAVEPLSFAPRNGELATFKLSASSAAGIDRWALNILDKNNNLVKTYVDIGIPPSQIMWNGSDNKYQLLPDGEYTFIFEATDKLGSTSSTPVQNVKIYTPVLETKNNEALKQLKALLAQLMAKDLKEDSAQAAIAKAGIAKLTKEKEKPTPVPPPLPGTMPANPFQAAQAPADAAQGMPNQATGTAAGPVSIVGFPNVDSGAIRSAYIQTMPDGQRQFNMEYVTDNTQPQYALKEMALMARSITESLGYSVNSIGINALYGGNNALNMVVPAAQAQNYSRGMITEEQMLRGSSITLNGEAIYPNF